MSYTSQDFTESIQRTQIELTDIVRVVLGDRGGAAGGGCGGPARRREGMSDRQRCSRCGRFFVSPNPYDEFCPIPRPCYWDDKAEKERWTEMSRRNREAMAAADWR